MKRLAVPKAFSHEAVLKDKILVPPQGGSTFQPARYLGILKNLNFDPTHKPDPKIISRWFLNTLCLAYCLTSLCFSCFPSIGFAGPPDAGSLLQENQQRPKLPSKERNVLPKPKKQERVEPTTDSDLKFPVTQIQVRGVTSVPLEKVQALVADAAGKTLTLGELNAYVRIITNYYHDAGYPLARAYIPAQQITDGLVKLAVLEGCIGRISIDNQTKLSNKRIRAYLDNMKSGRILDGRVMEKDLLLLSDLKGISVSSSLRPGESVGTTNLDVRVTPDKPYSGHVFVDNYGNSNTGALRGGADLTWGNLACLGDALSLSANTSKGLVYGRAAWQVPLGPRGTQLGTALSIMHYRLGEDYADLDAHGDAVIADFYLLHPLIRSRNLNLNSQLVYTHKNLDDDIDVVNTHNSKHIDVCTLGLSAERNDTWLGGGVIQASLSVSTGRLDLDDKNSALDAAGYGTAGGFTKLNAGFTRLQRLSDQWSLLADVRGQLAFNNLDSAEKMSIGGPMGVRAYPQGEAPADDAWLATLELRFLIMKHLQANAFYDCAQARINHDPLSYDTNNNRHLAGYGFGLSYTRENFRVSAGLAWRSADLPVSDKDQRPRIWAQAVLEF